MATTDNNKPHPEIIRGFSEPTKADIEHAEANTALEREWYADTPGFATNSEILKAYQVGKLEKIIETVGYRPATRFLNPDLNGIYPPFLPRDASALLEEVVKLWRARADKLGVSSDVRLSITSMSRSIEYQRELRAGGKLAVEDSTHTKISGGAVDLDLGGYYLGYGDQLRAVSLRTVAQQAPIRNVFRADLGASPIHVQLLGPEFFDMRVPQALMEATEELFRDRKINRLEEFAGNVNSCLHLAPQPDFISVIG